MTTQFLKRSFMVRILIAAIIAQFLIGANMAKVFARTDSLRSQATAESQLINDLKTSLISGTKPSDIIKFDGIENYPVTAQGIDPLKSVLGDYRITRIIDNLPFGSYLKKTIDLDIGVKAKLADIFKTPAQQGEEYSALYFRGTPIALERKSKEGKITIKKIVEDAAMPLNVLVEDTAEFQKEGKKSIDVILSDYLFLAERVNIPVPARMTIEYKELRDYIAELSKTDPVKAEEESLFLTGGKGKSLSLMDGVVDVPPGFNVSTTAYFKFVVDNKEVWEKINSELRQLDTMDDQKRDKVTREIREIIKNHPVGENIKREVLVMYRQLNILRFLAGKAVPTAVAVRSSGIKEDIKVESWLPITTGSQAGQSDTYLNVRGEKALLDKLCADWASLFTDRAVSYRDDAIFLIFSSVIGFQNKQPSQVYNDLKDKIDEYARQLNNSEFKFIASTLGELRNPGSVNLKSAMEEILRNEENLEIRFCLDKLNEVAEDFVNPEKIGIDVVTMQMVKSYLSGVLFTVNPATKMAGVSQALYRAWHGDDSLVYKNEKGDITGTKPIVSSSEKALGYGENVVGGKVDPDKTVRATYDGKKWFVIEKHKGTKLIQMIDVEESIALLKGKLDEAKIRSIASMVADAVSYIEVGKRINGILVSDLFGIKYLSLLSNNAVETDKDKRARVQKIAEDIANMIKDKESKARVKEFIASNFSMVNAGTKFGIHESSLDKLINKVFASVDKARIESDKGISSLTQLFGKQLAADNFISMLKEVWENKEFDLSERYTVLKALNLDSSEMKDLSYLIRALVDNSFTCNLGTKVQHQDTFCITEEMDVALARMGWDITTYYKDQRDVEFAFEIDPSAPEDKRLELYPLDLSGKYLAMDYKGGLVKVADKKDLVKFKKVPLRLYNVQARPYTANYAKVDLVRQRTEVDEAFIEEKGIKPIASGTKGENATHAFPIVFDPNKTIDWHAEYIKRLKRGEFTDAERELVKKAGFNPDDYGPGKDAKLPIALYLLEADPNHDPIMRLVDAVLTIRGGDTCHAAIFCREQGIPAITALGRVVLDGKLLSTGMGLTVDANNGNLYKLEADPAKRIPIHFVKFRIKPYGIPGDDDGMEYPKIGQIIASGSVAQQNSPIMLAVDSDGNSLTRAEFKAEEMGLNVFAGYGRDIIKGIKSGEIKRPVYISVQEVIEGKVAGANNFVNRLNSQSAKYFKGAEPMKLLAAFENRQDLSNLTQEQRDILNYLYGVFQTRFNFDYNIITQLEKHPWVIQEIEDKLREKGYTSFKEYAGEEFYEFYNMMGFTIAPDQKAKNRAYDFAQDKIRGMPGSEIFSWPGVNPLVGLRGSALEIEGLDEEFDGNQKVLSFLLEAVTKANENTHNQAWFYVFVRFPRELDSLDIALEKIAVKLGKLPKQIGAMIEIPSDALLADKLARKMLELKAKYKKYGCELVFFSFGTNDYSHLAGKGDREDPRMKLEIKDPAAIAAISEMKKEGYFYNDAIKKLPLIDEGANVMIQLMEAVVKEADALGVDTSLCGEAITSLVGRGDYDSAGKIMALLKSFGVSMMNVRLAASMTRYDTMAATKEIAVPEAQRNILVDLSSGKVNQKAGVIKGEIIYIDKDEDLVPKALKGLKGAALEEKKDFLKMQSAQSAQSTMRTYNKIVVLNKNLVAFSERELTDAMGAGLFNFVKQSGLMKPIGNSLYVWTNLGTSVKKFSEELEKIGYNKEELRAILGVWQKAWDNTAEGFEARGIDWDDLQYAKAIIVDDSVNLEGWDVFMRTKGIVPTRVKATVNGIGAMRAQLENQFVTIDYGAKKIYAGNLAVKKKEIILRGLPIPASEPVVPIRLAVQENANGVYASLTYHPLVILAYEEGKLQELEKIFDDYAGKLTEELGKIAQEQNPEKKKWLLDACRKKASQIPEPVIQKFIEGLLEKVSGGEKIVLSNHWDRDLREKYFQDLKSGIAGLLKDRTARDVIKDAFKWQMEQTIAANQGKFVVHTTTSMNCAKFSNMLGGFLVEQVNPNPDYGLLGAARAIGDFYVINRLELEAFREVRAALSKEERKDFGLQITELKGTQAGAIMIGWREVLKSLNIIPGEDGLEVGVNIATPTDTLAVDRYFEYFKDLGTGLSFVTFDKFKLGAAWAGVDIYWNEWRRLAKEEELLELGDIAAKIVKGKIEDANKADKEANKKLVVFDSGEVAVNAASAPVAPVPVILPPVTPVVTLPLAKLPDVVTLAQRLNIGRDDVQKAVDANKAVYAATAGEYFGRYTERITEQRRKGGLLDVELEAEKIFDSRKKPTVRANLRIGGISVVGEVPAGASKGKDEAPTVDTDRAIANINNEIVPALRQSGLDLSKHADLLKADSILAEKIKEWGANATVPVSWALWKAAARLNNMQLWEYIRWNEPGVFANGSVYFYMNIYNGGLHALKASEQLGKDRIDIQEIMIAPVGAKSHAEALTMGDKIDQALKKLLELDFAKSEITRADEAGFSVKGLGDSSRAIEYVLQAIKKAGYNPGVDVKLCLDVAATSFYNEKEDVYEFRGKKVTSVDMVDYYRALAAKYKGQIISIEDGLAENDWEGWKKLTEAMKGDGILTIGDDLFVTQLPRLTKGIAEKAATAILIKVNQNGTVRGTLDVIKLAKENGLEFVISHRSGETLDNAIADLAYATRALGLKTGDPQPSADFTNASELVRRAKYERMVDIEKNAQASGQVLIVTPECFRIGGMNNALQELEKLNSSLKIALYGEKADKLKAWVGNENIITAGSLNELLKELSKLGVTAINTLVLKASGEKIEEVKLNERGIRIVSGNIATLAVAKAVKELVGDEDAKDAFDKLLRDAEGKAIQKLSDDTRSKLLDKLAEGAFAFPEEVKVTEQVTKNAEQEKLVSEFIDKV